MSPSTEAKIKQGANPKNLAFVPAFAALVIGAIAMGASPVFVREAEVGPFASAFWRVCLGLPVLYVWAWVENRRMDRKISWQFTIPILLAGLFFAGDLIFWHLAILKTTMANATLMACLAPVWVALFSGVAIGESVPRNSFIGLAVCLTGAFLLLGSSYQLAPERISGDIYGLITSIFFGLYFLAVRVARRTHNGAEITLLSTFVTAVILLVFALLSGGTMIPVTLAGVMSLMALGMVCHAGGQGLLALALGSLTAAFSSLVIFVEAIAGAYFGWLIYNEQLGAWQIAGGILILTGVWIARPRTR